jgi:hypothetical protein
VILSLMTTAIVTLNAASFLLLAPGSPLGDYIACSAIYSVAAWLTLWVLPSVWEFDKKSMGKLRQAQVHCAVVASIVTLTFRPNAIGVLFVALLWLESLLFFSSILLMDSRTGTFQQINFARALGQTVGLALTVGRFHGDPTALCLANLIIAAAAGVLTRVLGVYAPPALRLRDCARADYLGDVSQAMRSKALRTMLAARLLEVIVLTAFNAFGRLGSVVCFKAGVSLSSALGTNARRHGVALLSSVGALLYLVPLVAVAFANVRFAGFVRGALAAVGIGDVLLAFPLVALFLLLVLRSLQPSRPSVETSQSDG